MAFSDEKVAAYKQLDEAIEAIRKAYECGDDILTGWVLLTSSVELQKDVDPELDELDLQSVNGWYTKRGQDPTLSYGILHEAIRHYADVQREYGDG